MKIDENTAHVGLSENEVNVGEHVELYSNKCKNTNIGRQYNADTEQSCKKIFKGHGTVTSIINSDYVVVKFDSGVTFLEGDFIEKHSH